MYDKLVLPNGVRIVSEHMDGVRSASIGIWVGAGSRYEKYSEMGSAHYIEHMLFKGTSKYTAAQLAEEMDAVGGQINAYTTRDSTCFYALVLDTHLPLAVEILSDMFFDSLFTEADTSNERGIILEEIGMYADTPEDVAVEQMFSKCFPGPLGRPVLGRPFTLAKQTGESLHAFKERSYIAPRIVVSLAGSFTDGDIAHIAERFSALPKAKDKKPPSTAYVPCCVSRKKSVEQEQLIIGFPGITVDSPRRFAMQLFSGILGGNASSRLFQTVREKYGLCYSIFTFSTGFRDTGVFALSTAVSRDTEDKAVGIIADELRRFRDDGVTETELSRAREQVKSSMLIGLEQTGTRMNRMGFGELFLGGALSPDQVTAAYDSVTRDDILALARDTLDFSRVSLSSVGRSPDKERYLRLLK